MSDFILAFWQSLSPLMQDILWTVILLLPAALIGAVILRGYAPWPLVRAILWRFRWSSALFVLLIAVSVGMGIGLLAQERGLRQGTAQAADKFDLVVSAPGSELSVMFAAVYLQASDMPLLSGAVYNEIAAHDHVSIAAPIAFGDSFGNAPVIGTTAEFARYLSDDRIEGRLWQTDAEAVVGALVPLEIGASFTPAHGTGDAAEHDAHESAHLAVVGRMAPTGTPWDRAILLPIEAIWEVHGLANGHAPDPDADEADHADADHATDHDHAQSQGQGHEQGQGSETDHDHAQDADAHPVNAHANDHAHDGEVIGGETRLGPPFDADYFPGTPAIVVHADELWANYALRSEFTRDAETMAFFPGAVLATLYRVMGDIRQAMSLMALVTQVLVAASVLLGLFILSQLFRRQIGLLRALGAPYRFAFAVVWSFGAVLLLAGASLGLATGLGAAAILSRVVTARTDIVVHAPLGWSEIHVLAGFVSVTLLMSLLPTVLMLRMPIVSTLRS